MSGFDDVTVNNPPLEWEVSQQIEYQGRPFIVWRIDYSSFPASRRAILRHGRWDRGMVVDDRPCDEFYNITGRLVTVFSPPN